MLMMLTFICAAITIAFILVITSSGVVVSGPIIVIVVLFVLVVAIIVTAAVRRRRSRAGEIHIIVVDGVAVDEHVIIGGRALIERLVFVHYYVRTRIVRDNIFR
jgi:hypothetical protein